MTVLSSILLAAVCAMGAGLTDGVQKESPFGVCAHLNRMPEKEAEQELFGMAQAGICFVRTDLDWNQVSSVRGVWDFSRWDAVVSAAERHGIGVLAILGGEMPKYGSPPYRHMEDWLEFVGRTAAHYRGRIHYYEVVNEADCGRPWGESPNPAHYAELLKKTYSAIKAADPAAQVLFTGVSDFGTPMEFVGEVFRNGGGDGFDIMNFHPYQWRSLPEAQLVQRIRDLRNLMRNHGIEKSVWITEIGNSSAPERFPMAKLAVSAALHRLGFSPETSMVGMIADPETLFLTDGLDDYLPEWKNRKVLSFAELAMLDPATCPIVALPGHEGFPASEIAAVMAYLRRGGTVVSPGGLPFYFDFQRAETPGLFRTRQVNDALLPQVHLGWEAFWVKPEVPRTTERTFAGPLYPGLRVPHRSAMRFLNAENLRGHDIMEPILLGEKGDYRAPVAALYRFDSDLKGNFIVCVDDAGSDSVTEEEQANRFAREYLLALSEGVGKVFNYRYRAGEWNRGREAHFGIVRRNFEAKAAWLACAALTRVCPAGSTRPELSISGMLYRATWKRPDGTRVTALWRPFGRELFALPWLFSGKILSRDGVERKAERGMVTVSGAVVYLLE